MGLYGKYILPRLVKLSLGSKLLAEERRKALADVEGRVLEVGFGNGLNLLHYPPAVREVVGIDPSSEAEKLARNDIARCAVPVSVHTGGAEDLPFEDHAFDSAVLTWTLCTIPDPARALGEIRRVLRPGGRLHFIEHGQAPDPKVALWQERLNGIQRFISGGCNLNRRIDRLISDAGFRIDALETYYFKGPRTHTFFYRGVSSPDSDA